MEDRLLQILKASSTGMTREEVLIFCCNNNIDKPLPVLKGLIEKGLVRVDDGHDGHPTRIKATNQAWS